MGLLAKERVLFVLIFFSMTAYARAQEDLFHLTSVDYFGMKVHEKEVPASSSAWLEPGYRPPQVVMDFLDDPNERTALQYLYWHRERLAKIARAQEILDKVSMSFSTEVKP